MSTHPTPAPAATAGFTAPWPQAKTALAALATVTSRAIAPVIGAARIVRDGNDAVVSTYNYDTAVTVRLPGAATGGDTPTLVPLADLASTANAATKGDPKATQAAHTLTVTPGGSTAQVSIAGFTTTLDAPWTPDEAPTLPPTGTVVAALPTDALRAVLTRVLTTASRSDADPEVLRGVHTVIADGQITVTSTDRYRLGQDSADVTLTSGDPVDVVVPRTAFEAVLKHLTEKNTTVRHHPGGDGVRATVTFTDGTVSITTVTIDGEFPRVARIFDDTDRPATATLTVGDARRVAVKCSALAPSRGTTRVDVADGGLRFSPFGDIEHPASGPVVPATITGDWTETHFNPRFLLDALATYPDTATVTLAKSPTNSRSAVLLTSQDPEDTYRHAIQPINPALIR